VTGIAGPLIAGGLTITIGAGWALGALIGDALALRLSPRYLLRWPRLLELLTVPMIVSLAFGAPAPALIGAALLLGITITLPDALWFTALQREVPEEALSRVSAFDMLGSLVLRPVGFSIAAVLVVVGAKASLLALAVVLISVTLLSMLAPGVRNLTRRPAGPLVESTVDAVAV
jgi:hypothetical protein